MENPNSLHSICIQAFQMVSNTTTILILPILVARITFSNAIGDGIKALSYIKGAVIYFLLIAAFPLMLDVLLSMPESFLPKYSSMNSFLEAYPGISTSLIPFSLDRILEVLLSVLYWLAYYLHVFFMIIMCSMAPIIFLGGTLLGVGLGLEIFMGVLIIGSSWPIVWYGFDLIHSNLASTQSDAFGSKCLELFITLLKGVAPVALASVAVKSPAGQAMTRSVHAAIGGAKWATSKTIAGASVAKKSHGLIQSRKNENIRNHQTSFFPGSSESLPITNSRLKKNSLNGTPYAKN